MVLGNLGYNLDGRRVYAICNAFLLFLSELLSAQNEAYI